VIFEHPENLGWLWALAAIPLIYLVRRRARRVRVPHLFLWERVLLGGRREKPSRLRDVISILVQGAIAAALIVAWAAPLRIVEGRGLERSLVVVQATISMSATTTAGKTRAQVARDAVLARAGELVRRGTVSVASASETLAHIAGPVRDRAALEDALDHVPPARGALAAADVAAKLREAAARARYDRVIFAGDGAFAAAADPAWPGVPIEILPAGDWRANAGIVALAVAAPERGRLRATVTVEAFGGEARRRLVLLDEGVEAAAQDVRLASGAAVEVALEADIEAPRWLDLELRAAAEDERDALAADDHAVFWFAPEPLAKVLVVAARADPPLRAAIAALDDVIDLRAAGTASPESWRAASGFDLVILRGVEEREPLPPGRYLLLDSFAPGLPLERASKVKDVEVLRQQPGEPILRGTDLRNVSIAEATAITPAAGARAILTGSCGALISTGDAAGVSFVHVAFDTDPANTSLTLLPAFPLLVKDALLALAGRDRRRAPPFAQAGGDLVLRGRPDDPRSLRLELWPDRGLAASQPAEPATLELDPAGAGGTFRAPWHLGRARLRFAGGDEPLGLDLLSRELSNVAPRWSAERAAASPPPARFERVRESLAHWFWAAALALLLLEWMTFHQGWTR
jgi:hypothetical protein